MANPILFLHGELGHCLSISRKDEEGIISEPFPPDFPESNPSLTGPFCDCLSSIRGYNSNHTPKSRPPF